MSDTCIACGEPLERNPLSGYMTCFLHPQGAELESINRCRVNLGFAPLPAPTQR